MNTYPTPAESFAHVLEAIAFAGGVTLVVSLVHWRVRFSLRTRARYGKRAAS